MHFLNFKCVVFLGALSLFLFLGVMPAYAIPIEINFKVKKFSPTLLSPTQTPAPDKNVKGTIIYEADSVFSDIESLISIDLTIDDHHYTLSEIGFISPFSIDRQKIGGTLNQVNGIGSHTDDFFLDWNKNTLAPFWLHYTSSSTEGIWSSINFSSFSIEEATPGHKPATIFSVEEANPVPEPATMILLGSGLIGLFGIRRKFRK